MIRLVSAVMSSPGGKFRILRPVICGLALFCITSYMLRSAQSIDYSERIRRHVSTFPNRFQPEDSNSDDASWDTPQTRSCDPYLEPGFLTTNPYDIAGTFWTPYDETCPRAPSFLQDVRDRKPLPWLDGRTLLLIGDSIERNNLRYFCELVGSNDLRTTPMRNLSATLREGNTIAEPADITRPRVCRVEEYDFEIVSFFHYGMQDEDIWSDTRIFTPPALMEERIGTVYDLFLESVRDFPDMVILASAGWVKDDARLNRRSSLTVDAERLDFFTMTAGRFAGWVHRFFPEARFYWRYLHHVAGDPAADFHEAQTGDRTPRSPFHELRIQQMNNAYNTVIDNRPFLNRFTWGELLTGHSYTFDDPIYPSRDVGGVLFADMMLYYMSQLPPREWWSDSE